MGACDRMQQRPLRGTFDALRWALNPEMVSQEERSGTLEKFGAEVAAMVVGGDIEGLRELTEAADMWNQLKLEAAGFTSHLHAVFSFLSVGDLSVKAGGKRAKVNRRWDGKWRVLPVVTYLHEFFEYKIGEADTDERKNFERKVRREWARCCFPDFGSPIRPLAEWGTD